MSDQQVLRGFLANLQAVPPIVLIFPFNPGTIRDHKAVKYSGENGEASSLRTYHGGARTISFSFQLHGLEAGTNPLNFPPMDKGIATELAKLRSFLYPPEFGWPGNLEAEDELGRWVRNPPTCFFGFGIRLLECVVTDIQIDETQFNRFLAPVRADVTVTLTAIEEAGHLLYEFDKLHRNVLALLGLVNARPI